ncbi:phosphopantetheine-binding protein [Nocardia brasiliensis]|uniref:phosphopantetheine-binding protein n=1 Tax=Nocardia brasiliensis TaxID=37326 RepID=UPI00366A91BA
MRIRHALGAAAAAVPAAAGIVLSDSGAAVVEQPQVTNTAATVDASEDVTRNSSIWIDRRIQASPELSLLPRSDQIRVRVLEVLAQLVGDEPDTGLFSELDMDEYDVAAFICDVEEEFGIYIPDQDANRLTSAGEVIEYIDAHH